VSDGLSQSSVYTIFQDSRGFIWFGTGDGLNRYDGYELKTYRNEFIPKVISHNNFYGYKAVEDRNGNIWFSSRAGIVLYNFKTDKIDYFYPLNDTISFTGEFLMLGITGGNELWFCNANDSIYHYSIPSGRLRSFTIQDPTLGPKQSFYRNADMDANGKIWYTLHYGIGSFDTRSYQFNFYLSDYYKKHNLTWTGDFLTLPDGDMILACYKMTLRFSPSKNTVQYIAGDSVNSLYFKSVPDRYGNLWLASINNGMACLTKDGRKIIYKNIPNDPNSISGNLVSRLFIDKSDNLWIGVDGQGIDKFNIAPPKFNLYRSGWENTGKLGANFIKCFYETTDKKLLVGTHDGGISVLDRKNKSAKIFNPEKPYKNTVSCFTTDSKGRIIMGSSLGVGYFDPTNGSVQLIPADFSPSGVHGQTNILSILYTTDHHLLIGTTIGLFGGTDATGDFKPIIKYKPFISQYIYHIFQSKDKSLWISAMGNVFRVKFKNEEPVIHESILYGNSVKCITEDTIHNILWMASENGLIKYFPATGKYDIISTKDGLSNNYLYSVVMDEKGNLWLSSNKGLMCYDPASRNVETYDESDGLQSNEFNTGSFYKSLSGELFFGGIKGFNSFFPSNVKPNPNPPDVVLTGFRLFDKPYKEQENCAALNDVILSYPENTVSFDFAALEYTNSKKNEYEYMLVGADQNRVSSGNKHYARYSGLKPGKYLFKVKASNNDGIWSEEKTLLTITVKAPWWLTWWFFILLSILLIGIGYVIVQLIINQRLKEQRIIIEKQKAVEEERTRISKDMHDDIGSGLSKIAIMSELLKTKAMKEEKTDMKKNIDKISSTAGELVDSMSHIVWAMNPQNDNLENLAAYIREYVLDFFDDFNVHCILDFPETIQPVHLTQQARRNIFLVIKESINNIVKYADADEIKISLSVPENIIYLSISDNGKGFDMNSTHRFGNGLINMKKRMEDIGGKYEIYSEKEKGCRTEIIIPC